jgi:hypothetical protein
VPDGCVTVCVRPATVSWPVLVEPDVFRATVNEIVRDPDPHVLKVIQETPDVAVQKHPEVVDNATVAVPPPGSTL